MSNEERQLFMGRFLERDPIPETPANELDEGIRRRTRLVQAELLSPLDDRAKLLFLRGKPHGRFVLDCAEAFRPMELWTYGVGERPLILFQPRGGRPYRLWLPLDSKRVLYTEEMEYWMEQWEELGKRITGKRIDRQVCPEAPRVDGATGIDGLSRVTEGRRDNRELLAYLAAPDDMAAWAREAAATEVDEPAAELGVAGVEVQFPSAEGQRIVVRLLVRLPGNARVEPFVDEEKEHRELRFAIHGVVEQEGELFDEVRVRYALPPPDDGQPVALVLERPLRRGRSFLVRLKVEDEVGGAESRLVLAVRVPAEPQPVEEPPVPEDVIVALGEELSAQRLPGADGLILIPPDSDVVFGRWRAEAIVSGERIEQVVFSVDGEPQLIRRSAPFSVELKIPTIPQQLVVRAEGLDGNGALVAADEVILNQPRGELKVLILEPERGQAVGRRFLARAEVVVPETRRVEKVDFLINQSLVATTDRPPWTAQLEMPQTSGLIYLTVVAELDDGSRSEEVRFLHIPYAMEEVDVRLVELYTTVTDRAGAFVVGLQQDDFEVFEDGRPQKLSKFELVQDLPLTVGITIDTSGSMAASLGEAQRAAVGFLDRVISDSDRAFAVGFASRPALLMPRTVDVEAVGATLEPLQADGWTSLHDAVVFSLYYFRGVRGRRALILLSDGDDTASQVPFREGLEYARRSGVVVYAIGLKNEALNLKARRKLESLATETGGRVFFIDRAEELFGVYEEIEEELRSQYLLAFASDRPPQAGEFRNVEVKVKKSGLKARTISGYYP
jgi:VWFA-related protein